MSDSKQIVTRKISKLEIKMLQPFIRDIMKSGVTYHCEDPVINEILMTNTDDWNDDSYEDDRQDFEDSMSACESEYLNYSQEQ